MERDSHVQRYKHQIAKLLREGGSEKKIKRLQEDLAMRLEYLDRHGLANKPKKEG